MTHRVHSRGGRHGTLVVLMVLGLVLAGPVNVDPLAAGLTADLTIVSMAKHDYLSVDHILSPTVLVDYESFVWLGLKPASLNVLLESRVNFSLEPEATML